MKTYLICIWRMSLIIGMVICLLSLTGCETTPRFSNLDESKAKVPDPLVLREGDSVRISFPGAPNLNTVQQIKRDGRIALQLVGEVQASGLTAKQLEKELLRLYGPQLQTKEVTVAVENSALVVYVTGAVLRPGKITPDRTISVLEAVLEAGGFDPAKANQKAVTVIRNESGQVAHYKVNVKRMLDGEDTEAFVLKPGDIVYVPERFVWF